MTFTMRAYFKEQVSRSNSNSHPHSSDTLLNGPVRGAQVIEVLISDVREADSPRSTGVDAAHVRTLAQIDTPLPPILVHRPTMRIVDGVHRVAAARLNGRTGIRAVFLSGSVEEAFRLGVRANVAHGLPLSLPDRRAAAARIIASHPELSDRAIASSVGLAAKTIAAMRNGLEITGPTTARIGRDGRIRPLNATTGRRAAMEILSQRPGASLREVAREAGISVSTAHDVRVRLKAGRDPVASHESEAPGPGLQPGGGAVTKSAVSGRFELVLQRLQRDPSLRYSDTGRAVLRLLELQRGVQVQWQTIASSMPAHCLDALADVATQLARNWAAIAAELAADIPSTSDRDHLRSL